MFLNIDAAGASAGFPVRLPTALPPGLALTGIEVAGEHAARITGDTTALHQMLEALGIRDLRVPSALDGQTALVKVPPVVRIRYDYGNQHVGFYQGRSPEVTLPAGVDLPMLGEIGLRILGLDRTEAYRLAQAIDWRSTLIVPVPATATTFRQVQVRGHRGLLVETASASERRPPNMVLWSEGEQVYGLRGELLSLTLLQMANSVE